MINLSKFAFSLILLLVSSATYAQNKKNGDLDSLLSKFSVAAEDTNKVNLSLKIGALYQKALPTDPAGPGCDKVLERLLLNGGYGDEAVIFEPFLQSDDSATRPYGGAGLGLTIASQLVRLMGGTLAVESVLGSGTTFSFAARTGVAG